MVLGEKVRADCISPGLFSLGLSPFLVKRLE
jgi:hypothetical protein